jgi:spore coat polysaccharide biosynthesis protein SpsF
MKNILIICQARYGSTRLPGKVLLKILDKPLLWYVIKRLEQVKTKHKIIIATVDSEENLPIVNFAKSFNLDYFLGSEEDVLDRYYLAAKKFNGEILVRITSDCPLTDPSIIDQALEIFLNGNYDYVCNVEPPTYPDGFDIEIFSYEALEKTWREANRTSLREHVTLYIREDMRNNEEKFKTFNFKNDKDYQDYRLTVDTKEDFELISIIIKEFYDRWHEFTMNDIIEFIDNNQKLKQINAKYERDEGLDKSYKEDKIIQD